MRTGVSRGFVAVSAAGAAVIHGATAATTSDGGVGAVLVVAGVAEPTIAAGAAVGARWLPLARTDALLLVTPVLVAATLPVPARAATLQPSGANDRVRWPHRPRRALRLTPTSATPQGRWPDR